MNQSLTLKDLNFDEHMTNPARKQDYVTRVFEIVARSYDGFTRLCSFGMDQRWKRDLVRLASSKVQSNHSVLDLATGTGDMAFGLAPYVSEGRVIGIDIAPNMIKHAEQAKQSRGVKNVVFRVGDLMATELADESVDLITVSYGLRNCPNFCAALAEMHRVLRPGGSLAVLDFVRPNNAIWESVFVHALLMACNFYGWLWHREAAAYGYLARSIRHFVTNAELVEAMNDAGFTMDVSLSRLGGAITILLLQKRFVQ